MRERKPIYLDKAKIPKEKCVEPLSTSKLMSELDKNNIMGGLNSNIQCNPIIKQAKTKDNDISYLFNTDIIYADEPISEAMHLTLLSDYFPVLEEEAKKGKLSVVAEMQSNEKITTFPPPTDILDIVPDLEKQIKTSHKKDIILFVVKVIISILLLGLFLHAIGLCFSYAIAFHSM